MNTHGDRAKQLRRDCDESVVQEGKEAAGPFMTVSSRPIERLYDATDVAGIDYEPSWELHLAGC